MLATEHLLWLLRSASPLVAHCRSTYHFALYFNSTAPPHINLFLLGSTRSFLHWTNISLKHKYVSFHCSILLYTFVVLQVEHLWCMLSIMYTVKVRRFLYGFHYGFTASKFIQIAWFPYWCMSLQLWNIQKQMKLLFIVSYSNDQKNVTLSTSLVLSCY